MKPRTPPRTPPLPAPDMVQATGRAMTEEQPIPMPVNNLPVAEVRPGRNNGGIERGRKGGS